MNIERLQEKIGRLVLERQSLHDRRASALELERNRLQIVRCQWELSYALIESHRPEPVPLKLAA
jgi:hypothetical protein